MTADKNLKKTRISQYCDTMGIVGKATGQPKPHNERE